MIIFLFLLLFTHTIYAIENYQLQMDVYRETQEHDVETYIMKMWTEIDVLRGIHLTPQEKFGFLSELTDIAFAIYEHIKRSSLELTKKEWFIELIAATGEAFDDLYDMLTADEIGAVRVIFRRSIMHLTAPDNLKS